MENLGVVGDEVKADLETAVELFKKYKPLIDLVEQSLIDVNPELGGHFSKILVAIEQVTAVIKGNATVLQ